MLENYNQLEIFIMTIFKNIYLITCTKYKDVSRDQKSY